MNRYRPQLLCLLLAACTHDFAAFDFSAAGDGGAREPGDSGGEPEGGRGSTAGTGSGTGGRGGAGARDAAVDPTQPDATPGSDASFADATTPVPDAGAGDAAIDAGGVDASEPPPDPGPCLDAWSATPPGPTACGDCACASCTTAVAACLTEGSPSEQALCADVLACAITNDCMEWDCYCTSPQCGSPTPDGNGPCVAVINAAAGGTRDDVVSISVAADPQEPLVRANAAVRCVIGASRRSPGGEAAGSCNADCL